MASDEGHIHFHPCLYRHARFVDFAMTFINARCDIHFTNISPDALVPSYDGMVMMSMAVVMARRASEYTNDQDKKPVN